MLHAAGLLTLDLAQALLADGLGLKDGTPYNILFRGPEPVFIDVLCFERRQPGDPTWLPYAQFVRTFLLPLLANQAYGLGLDQILTTRRDGLEPEEVYRWSKPSQRLRPPFFSLVSMPTWLGGKHKQDDTSIYQKKLLSDPEKARFILDHVLNGLRRTLHRLKPVEGKSSVWSDYMTTNNNYTADHFQAKQRFVGEALDRVSVALRARCGLQHGPLQRDCGAQRRQGGGGRLRPGGAGRCVAQRAKREAGDPAAGGEPDAAEPGHRVAQSGVLQLSGPRARQVRCRADAGGDPSHAGDRAGAAGRHHRPGGGADHQPAGDRIRCAGRFHVPAADARTRGTAQGSHPGVVRDSVPPPL